MFARTPPHHDQGQALPVYITVVGALLFLAFAYFAVGQAAATRNGAQTAADSAALAAAQDRGDQLRDELLRAFRSGSLGTVGALLDGRFPGLRDSCARAEELAEDNRAHTTDCARVWGPDGYRVSVVTDYTVGRSVIPGTQRRRARAGATAVMTPLCRWRADPASPPPSAPPSAPPAAPGASSPPDEGTGPGQGSGPAGGSPGTLRCRGGDWTVDLSNLGLLPSTAELFSVHLTR